MDGVQTWKENISIVEHTHGSNGVLSNIKSGDSDHSSHIDTDTSDYESAKHSPETSITDITSKTINNMDQIPNILPASPALFGNAFNMVKNLFSPRMKHVGKPISESTPDRGQDPVSTPYTPDNTVSAISPSDLTASSSSNKSCSSDLDITVIYTPPERELLNKKILYLSTSSPLLSDDSYQSTVSKIDDSFQSTVTHLGSRKSVDSLRDETLFANSTNESANVSLDNVCVNDATFQLIGDVINVEPDLYRVRVDSLENSSPQSRAEEETTSIGHEETKGVKIEVPADILESLARLSLNNTLEHGEESLSGNETQIIEVEKTVDDVKDRKANGLDCLKTEDPCEAGLTGVETELGAVEEKPVPVGDLTSMVVTQVTEDLQNFSLFDVVKDEIVVGEVVRDDVLETSPAGDCVEARKLPDAIKEHGSETVPVQGGEVIELPGERVTEETEIGQDMVKRVDVEAAATPVPAEVKDLESEALEISAHGSEAIRLPGESVKEGIPIGQEIATQVEEKPQATLVPAELLEVSVQSDEVTKLPVEIVTVGSEIYQEMKSGLVEVSLANLAPVDVKEVEPEVLETLVQSQEATNLPCERVKEGSGIDQEQSVVEENVTASQVPADANGIESEMSIQDGEVTKLPCEIVSEVSENVKSSPPQVLSESIASPGQVEIRENGSGDGPQPEAQEVGNWSTPGSFGDATGLTFEVMQAIVESAKKRVAKLDAGPDQIKSTSNNVTLLFQTEDKTMDDVEAMSIIDIKVLSNLAEGDVMKDAAVDEKLGTNTPVEPAEASVATDLATSLTEEKMSEDLSATASEVRKVDENFNNDVEETSVVEVPNESNRLDKVEVEAVSKTEEQGELNELQAEAKNVDSSADEVREPIASIKNDGLVEDAATVVVPEKCRTEGNTIRIMEENVLQESQLKESSEMKGTPAEIANESDDINVPDLVVKEIIEEENAIVKDNSEEMSEIREIAASTAKVALFAEQDVAVDCSIKAVTPTDEVMLLETENYVPMEIAVESFVKQEISTGNERTLDKTVILGTAGLQLLDDTTGEFFEDTVETLAELEEQDVKECLMDKTVFVNNGIGCITVEQPANVTVGTDKANSIEEVEQPANVIVIMDKTSNIEEIANATVVIDKTNNSEEIEQPANVTVIMDKTNNIEEIEQPANVTVVKNETSNFEEIKQAGNLSLKQILDISVKQEEILEQQFTDSENLTDEKILTPEIENKAFDLSTIKEESYLDNTYTVDSVKSSCDKKRQSLNSTISNSPIEYAQLNSTFEDMKKEVDRTMKICSDIDVDRSVADGTIFVNNDVVDIEKYIQEQFTAKDVEAICSVIGTQSSEHVKKDIMRMSNEFRDFNNLSLDDLVDDTEQAQEEDFHFKDPNCFDFLASVKSTTNPRDYSRESLYVKFDPLVQPEVEMLSFSSPPTVKKPSPVKIQQIVQPLVQNDGEKKKELMKEIDRLRKQYENNEIVYRSREDEMEKQISRLIADKYVLEDKLKSTEDIERSLVKRLSDSVKTFTEMKLSMRMYDELLEKLLKEKEKMRIEHEEKLEKLTNEKDDALSHLDNLEQAFTDLHNKYEKAKSLIDAYKKNKLQMDSDVNEHRQRIIDLEHKLANVHKDETESKDKLRKEMERCQIDFDEESNKLKIQIKKLELKLGSLQQSLNQKTKENLALTSLCDEMIAGKRSN